MYQPHLHPLAVLHEDLHRHISGDPCIAAAILLRPRAVLFCYADAFSHYSLGRKAPQYRVTFEPGVTYYLEGQPASTRQDLSLFLDVLTHDPFYWRIHHLRVRQLQHAWCRYGLHHLTGGIPRLRVPQPEPRRGPGVMSFRIADQRLLYRVDRADYRLHIYAVFPYNAGVGLRARYVTA